MSTLLNDAIQKAVTCLKNGDVIGLPTETVYGLAARIDSDLAIRKIFSTKERPFFDPLIVHVSSVEMAKTLVQDWPPLAQKLAEAFWPGPLTIILPKKNHVNDLITSGLQTVALRFPSHPVALEIIKQVGVPLAAPSANKFGKTSPTTAAHVKKEFGDQVFVVDGGSCEIGIESTVVTIKNDKLAVLRPGMISQADLQKSASFEWLTEIKKEESPGHIEHHYQPDKPLLFISLGSPYEEYKKSTYSELKLAKDAATAARELYSEMRRCAESGADQIVFFEQQWHTQPEWAGIRDRLKKASQHF